MLWLVLQLARVARFLARLESGKGGLREKQRSNLFADKRLGTTTPKISIGRRTTLADSAKLARVVPLKQEVPLRHRQHLRRVTGQEFAVSPDAVGVGIDTNVRHGVVVWQ